MEFHSGDMEFHSGDMDFYCGDMNYSVLTWIFTVATWSFTVEAGIFTLETAHFTVETRIFTVETMILTVETWTEYGVGLDSGLLGAMFVIALFFFLFLLGNVSNLTGQTAYRLLPNPCGGPSWRHASQALPATKFQPHSCIISSNDISFSFTDTRIGPISSQILSLSNNHFTGLKLESTCNQTVLKLYQKPFSNHTQTILKPRSGINRFSG